MVKEYSLLLNLTKKKRYYDFNYDKDDNYNHSIKDIIDLNNNESTLTFSDQSIISTISRFNESSGNSSGNEEIFLKKIWGNITIRYQILNHLKLYNKINNVKFYGDKYSKTNIQYLKSMPIKEYLKFNKPSSVTTISFGAYENHLISELQYQITDIQLKENRIYKSYNRTIKFPPSEIPNTIESICFMGVNPPTLSNFPFPNSIKSLSFHSYYKSNLKPSNIPRSVTQLKLSPIHQSTCFLKKFLFNSSVKSIKIANIECISLYRITN